MAEDEVFLPVGISWLPDFPDESLVIWLLEDVVPGVEWFTKLVSFDLLPFCCTGGTEITVSADTSVLKINEFLLLFPTMPVRSVLVSMENWWGSSNWIFGTYTVFPKRFGTQYLSAIAEKVYSVA